MLIRFLLTLFVELRLSIFFHNLYIASIQSMHTLMFIVWTGTDGRSWCVINEQDLKNIITNILSSVGEWTHACLLVMNGKKIRRLWITIYGVLIFISTRSLREIHLWDNLLLFDCLFFYWSSIDLKLRPFRALLPPGIDTGTTYSCVASITHMVIREPISDELPNNKSNVIYRLGCRYEYTDYYISEPQSSLDLKYFLYQTVPTEIKLYIVIRCIVPRYTWPT